MIDTDDDDRRTPRGRPGRGLRAGRDQGSRIWWPTSTASDAVEMMGAVAIAGLLERPPSHNERDVSAIEFAVARMAEVEDA